MKAKHLVILAALPLLSVLLLASCGGGGGAGTAGGGSVGALTVAEKVSVVDAQAGGAGGAAPIYGAAARTVDPSYDPPAGSDYQSDNVHVYVEERSVQSFKTVNEILCMMAQTRYDAMLNTGDYRALVDKNQCADRDSASAGGQQSANQSSGSNMPSYEMWTVNSSRTDAAAPQIVKAWVHEPASEFEPAKVIEARVTITEGVGAANPFGLFTLNFQAHPVVGGVPQDNVIFRGYLKTERDPVTERILLKFYNNGGFPSPQGAIAFTEQVVLNRGSAGTSGDGLLKTQESSPMGSQGFRFKIAFNDNNFLRQDQVGSPVCLDRKDFDVSAWRYGLYTSGGARVNRNSGFPVRISKNGEHHGFIGYWGAWFPDNVTVATGDIVYRQAFGPGSAETAYEVLVAGGKLKRHTRNILALGEIAGVPLDLMEFDPVSGTDNQFRVSWTGLAFTKSAKLNKATWTWEDLTPPQDIDLGALRYPELNFWSQALSGNVQIKLASCVVDTGGTPDPMDDRFSCAADNTTPVVSYVEATVRPTDTLPATLACFENCPDFSKILGGDAFPFRTDISGFQQTTPDNATYAAFAFDGSNMVLKDASDNAIVAATLPASMPWGLMSGPLFEPTQANLDLTRCDWDNNATCGWQARSNLPAYYTWETGPNSWNRFTAVRPAGGSFLDFDPPLQVYYTHATGAKYLLEYTGFGDLHGIPGTCVDMNSGQAVDCGQGGPGIRWIPEFSIPDRSMVVPAGAPSTTYYVKALEKEQRMKVNAGGCGSLQLPGYADADLPPGSDWQDPSIGTEPDVTAPPAVVGGVVQ